MWILMGEEIYVSSSLGVIAGKEVLISVILTQKLIMQHDGETISSFQQNLVQLFSNFAYQSAS